MRGRLSRAEPYTLVVVELLGRTLQKGCDVVSRSGEGEDDGRETAQGRRVLAPVSSRRGLLRSFGLGEVVQGLQGKGPAGLQGCGSNLVAAT